MSGEVDCESEYFEDGEGELSGTKFHVVCILARLDSMENRATSERRFSEANDIAQIRDAIRAIAELRGLC